MKILLSIWSSNRNAVSKNRRKYFGVTFFLMLLVCLQVSAGVYSQRLSIHKKNATLISVIKEIKDKTGVLFLYSNEVIDRAKPVTINLENATVTEILEKCFYGQPLAYEVKENTIVIKDKKATISPVVTSYEKLEKTIKGTVTDANDGLPLPGVTIMVKGTHVGAVTDLDGKYTIDVPENSEVLIFSYIGYLNKEVELGDRSIIDVQLIQNAAELDEVVVVGYGTMKKVNLSGAVDMVEAETIENRQIPNVGEGLQGLIPNLNITRSSGRAGDGPSFNIRGFTSLNGGSPLILVDNVPVTESELVNINPADIETVSVLKDAASAAVYGARAAFGVVLITTKTANTENLKVSGNILYGVKTLGNIPDIVSDPYLAMKYKHEAAWPLYNLYPEASREYALQRSNDPSLPSVIINPDNPERWQYIGQTDWLNEIYRNSGSSYTANFTVSKMDENLNYYFSGGYYRQDGMLKYGNDKFERFNLRAKTDMKITDWLKVGNNTAFANGEYDKPYYNEWLFFHNTNRTNSLDVPRNPDGSWTSAGAGLLGRLQEGGRNISSNNDIQTKFDVEISLIKDLFSLKADATFRRINRNSNLFDVPVPYKVGPDMPVQYQGPNPGFAESSAGSVKHNIYNVYGDFKKTFGEKHYLQGLIGYNQEYKVDNGFWVNRKELITSGLPSISLATGDWNGNESFTDWAVRGAFYRLNYTYADRYIVEFNGRYDGSSRFPKDDRFGFFPSASVAWVASEEGFLKGLAENINMDFLKFRASYGSLGNQSVGNYGYIPSMASGQIGQILGGERPLTVSPPGLVAGSLTWETVQSKNLGVDVNFLQGKLGMNFDVYSRKTKDMLVKGKTLPSVLGASEPKINAGDLVTRGWELRVNWQDEALVGGSPLRYGIGINLSDYQSEILSYDNPTGYLGDYYVGQKIGQIWGLTNDGFFQSEAELDQLDQRAVGSDDQGYVFYVGDLKFKDLNGDAMIDKGDWTLENHGDFEIIGNTTPRYQYGVDLNGSWKGFDLRVFLQGVGKKDWYPEASNHYFWGIYAQPWTNVQAHNLDHWTPENPNGYFPRVKSYIAEDRSELGLPQTRYLQNAAYMRVKNLTIGYSFPQSLLQRAKINKLRVYVTAENLFEVSHLKAKLDPEVIGSNGGSNTTAYPFQRTFSFGLNFTL
ncbi:TonB-dependent receptor [Echinicola shivajiensis]|uniref:TonB-dependent receptor n=1 Tax=Echinicola shivajiensis TaxID=1035916 RepID=UPI001BFC2906|nr:TonB-dependent receptor [Echinicola shivajiensis]